MILIIFGGKIPRTHNFLTVEKDKMLANVL